MTVVATRPDVRLSPRRLGHVNMYVADLERSFAFYHDVCGLQLVFDEPGIRARFLSNGNSHHDVALMGVTQTELRGRDGLVQVSRQRGAAPGLNHLAFEMESEAALVAGIERMRAASLRIDRLFDHQVSRSAYITSPWRVKLELYADSDPDWRAVYRRIDGELMSARWDPSAGNPSERANYVDELDHRPVPGAPARPLRTSSATIVVPDVTAAIEWYERVVGLQVIATEVGAVSWAVLGGTLGRGDLQLLKGANPGLHHFTLELTDERELELTTARVVEAGVPIVRRVVHPGKSSIVIMDPDGVPVELAAFLPGAARYGPLGPTPDPLYVA